MLCLSCRYLLYKSGGTNSIPFSFLQSSLQQKLFCSHLLALLWQRTQCKTHTHEKASQQKSEQTKQKTLVGVFRPVTHSALILWCRVETQLFRSEQNVLLFKWCIPPSWGWSFACAFFSPSNIGRNGWTAQLHKDIWLTAVINWGGPFISDKTWLPRLHKQPYKDVPSSRLYLAVSQAWFAPDRMRKKEKTRCKSGFLPIKLDGFNNFVFVSAAGKE